MTAKKRKRQRAVITITEDEDPVKFKATILFEPSIRKMPDSERRENPVVMAAYAAWLQLKMDHNSVIILTDND